ncbi:BrxA family protein [Bradyrhizobium sp. JYMT SZCCT0428]|uniref:BrxA family protein n=1 Tax=Bradyrhizobium sp. JYMT SZCCT0428 TaxID=2807673 RepID=UPI001BADB4E8|nr:BrxA family protein [Bradyrhizobium sp. JYMT SZCCT0428]MBR1157028.1 DUF1819 family protein [Bradyrhizobium sp. JYMT SZCCT0428]
MIDETYAVFAAWDFGSSKKENLDRLKRDNFIGASATTCVRDIAKVLYRRFDPIDRDRALVLLAKNGCPIDEWKPILLWHITRDEFLLRDFLIHWLFPTFGSGAYRVRTEDLTSIFAVPVAEAGLPNMVGVTRRNLINARYSEWKDFRSLTLGGLAGRNSYRRRKDALFPDGVRRRKPV